MLCAPISASKVYLTKVKGALLKYNTAAGHSVFVQIFDGKSGRDRGNVSVLLPHRDELGQGDHLFAFGDGVKK